MPTEQQAAARVEAEIDGLLDNSPELFERRLNDLAVGIWFNNLELQVRARQSLQRLIGESMALADVIGRRRVALELAAIDEAPKMFARQYGKTPVIPQVPFREAFDDIINRLAVTFGKDIKNRGIEIARLYSEKHAFALAGSTSRVLTERVRQSIAKSIRRGESVTKASEAISKIGGFTKGYAHTVYRTNLTTAYTAGRFKQLENENVRKVIRGLKYSIRGINTRDNHRANSKIWAEIDDPIWNTHSPPQGYNCHCRLILVSKKRFERKMKSQRRLRADGSVRPAREPSGGGPDTLADGSLFVTNRPDRAIYG